MLLKFFYAFKEIQFLVPMVKDEISDVEYLGGGSPELNRVSAI